MHALILAPAANDCEQTPTPDRLPSAWRARRQEAAGLVVEALRARGVTGGQCARWWQEAVRVASARLAGDKPLCAEHLRALPPDARRAALEALLRAA